MASMKYIIPIIILIGLQHYLNFCAFATPKTAYQHGDYRAQSTRSEQQQQRYPNSYQQQYGLTAKEDESEEEEYAPRYNGNIRRSGENSDENKDQRLQRRRLNRQNSRFTDRPKERRPNIPVSELHKQKCRIWIPSETFDKYPLASKIQTDQSKQLDLIEICCAGYSAIQWRASVHCLPVCENCSNGFCAAPGECQCHEGYVQNDNRDCVFTCPVGCLNGRCYLDGSCQCDPGYKLDKTRRFCRPICSVGCGQNPVHNCTEPEICGCRKGYLLTDAGCQPTCQPDCGIGGKCEKLNICKCETGFNLKDGVCQSDCYQKCDNGICHSRNRCICNPGFKYHERSMQCVPV